MLLPDVNVLVYAHRAESPDHAEYAEWIRALAGGREPFGLSDLGASGFVRVVTNSKIWDKPTSTEEPTNPPTRCSGCSHACVVTPTGGVSCWGSGVDGKLGNGKTGYHPSPQPLPALP